MCVYIYMHLDLCNIHKLVGGLEHVFFPFSWECHHPNWRVVHHFSEGWLKTTNQSLLLTIINHIITMVLTIINSILTIINVHYPKIGTCETLIHITCSARPIGPSQFDHFPSTVWRKFWWRNSYVRLSNPYICPC